jgi:Flp pilus assembly pilin Flp
MLTRSYSLQAGETTLSNGSIVIRDSTELACVQVKTALQKLAAFVRKGGRGQDLAEYTLVIAFVALVALGILLQASGGIQGIWKQADAALAAGKPAGGGSGGGSTSSPASKPVPPADGQQGDGH